MLLLLDFLPTLGEDGKLISAGSCKIVYWAGFNPEL
jgi:hypothetical protein